jgi:hypothetical protein
MIVIFAATTCSRCGYFNPRTAVRCLDCGLTLRPRSGKAGTRARDRHGAGRGPILFPGLRAALLTAEAALPGRALRRPE